jgi:hypothetical protein
MHNEAPEFKLSNFIAYVDNSMKISHPKNLYNVMTKKIMEKSKSFEPKKLLIPPKMILKTCNTTNAHILKISLQIYI